MNDPVKKKWRVSINEVTSEVTAVLPVILKSNKKQLLICKTEVSDYVQRKAFNPKKIKWKYN